MDGCEFEKTLRFVSVALLLHSMGYTSNRLIISDSKSLNEMLRFRFYILKNGIKNPEKLCDWTVLLYYISELLEAMVFLQQ